MIEQRECVEKVGRLFAEEMNTGLRLFLRSLFAKLVRIEDFGLARFNAYLVKYEYDRPTVYFYVRLPYFVN